MKDTEMSVRGFAELIGVNLEDLKGVKSSMNKNNTLNYLDFRVMLSYAVDKRLVEITKEHDFKDIINIKQKYYKKFDELMGE